MDEHRSQGDATKAGQACLVPGRQWRMIITKWVPMSALITWETTPLRSGRTGWASCGMASLVHRRSGGKQHGASRLRLCARLRTDPSCVSRHPSTSMRHGDSSGSANSNECFSGPWEASSLHRSMRRQSMNLVVDNSTSRTICARAKGEGTSKFDGLSANRQNATSSALLGSCLRMSRDD